MSLFNYIETPNTNLVCCICRAPFTDPTTTQTCAHTFCNECILRALSHSSICPIDRSPLSLADLRPANPIVRSLVDELQVECVHRQEGCLHTCQRQTMSLHLRDDCEYGEAHCPVLGCEELLRRGEIADHVEKMHGDEKGDTEATDGGEEEDLKDNEEEVHICPHAALGCPYRGPQEPSNHLSSCPYESFKWFFTNSNATKISLLIEQNMLLRHRINTLETAMQTLERDMNIVRNVLGPWFGASHQAGGSVGGADVGITSSELPVGVQHYAAGPSQPMPVREDPLAPYFPPAESVVQRPTISYRAPSSMVGDTYNRTGMMGVVTPPDLGTTLEGVLVGLREGMTGLAVGIDSVARRSEIGLTNETLRLGEEMMSVRAQMHGLRMQMHGMMMDRNTALRSEQGQYFQPPILPAAPPPPCNRNFGAPPSITKL